LPEGILGEKFLNGYFVVGLVGSSGDIFAGKPGGGLMNRYVMEAAGGKGQVPGNVPPIVGKTALLILKIEIRPGKDRISLIVNPEIGKPEPKTEAVTEELDLGEIKEVMLYSTGAHVVDEIRFGSSYASALPTINKSKK